MDYSIVMVTEDNYFIFDDMIFWRHYEREKNDDEKKINDFSQAHSTLENKNFYVFAAQVDDKFVGYISATYIPKISRTNGRGHLFIDELWVNPHFRKRGIANALMKRVDTLSKEINTLGLRLYVNTTNVVGISFYKKCGYKDKYGMALFMEKEWDI